MKLSQTLKNPLVLVGIAGAVILVLWMLRGRTNLFSAKPQRLSAYTMDIADNAKAQWETPVSRSEAPPLAWTNETPASSSEVPEAFGSIEQLPAYASGAAQRKAAGLRTIQQNDEEIDLGDYLGTGKRQVIKVHRTLSKLA